ncbi:myosin-14-like [Ornithodoros turicata]|uniref:myosin-14-like n=1 Tax=Ornithodoros turicata TaxID=34597 RepID=UPI003139C616
MEKAVPPSCPCLAKQTSGTEVTTCCSTVEELHTELENKNAEIASLKNEIAQLKDTVRERLSQENLLAEAQVKEDNSKQILAATEIQLRQKVAETEQLQRRLENALAELGATEELKISLCEKNDQVNALTEEIRALQEALQLRDEAKHVSEVIEADTASSEISPHGKRNVLGESVVHSSEERRVPHWQAQIMENLESSVVGEQQSTQSNEPERRYQELSEAQRDRNIMPLSMDIVVAKRPIGGDPLLAKLCFSEDGLGVFATSGKDVEDLEFPSEESQELLAERQEVDDMFRMRETNLSTTSFVATSTSSPRQERSSLESYVTALQYPHNLPRNWSIAVEPVLAQLQERNLSLLADLVEVEESLIQLRTRKRDSECKQSPLCMSTDAECSKGERHHPEELESDIKTLVEEREEIRRRWHQHREEVGAVADDLQDKLDALRRMQKDADESDSMVEVGVSEESLEWSYSQEHALQERFQLDFCGKGAMSKGSERGTQEWLTSQIEDICDRLSSLGRSLRNMETKPEPVLHLNPQLLAGHIRNFQLTYSQLFKNLESLQNRLDHSEMERSSDNHVPDTYVDKCVNFAMENSVPWVDHVESPPSPLSLVPRREISSGLEKETLRTTVCEKMSDIKQEEILEQANDQKLSTQEPATAQKLALGEQDLQLKSEAIDLHPDKIVFNRMASDFNAEVDDEKDEVDEKDELFIELHNLRESYSQVQRDRHRLQEQIDDVLKQAEEQEQELLRIDDILKVNEALKCETERLSGKDKEVIELSAKILCLEEENAKLHVRCKRTDSLERALELSRDQFTVAEHSLSHCEKKVNSLEVDLAEAVNTNRVYECKLREVEENLATTKDEATFLRAKGERLQIATSKNCELSKVVEILKDRNKDLSEEIENARRQVEHLQVALDERKRASQMLLQERAAQNDKILALSVEIAKYKSHCAAADEELKGATLLHEGIRRKIESEKFATEAMYKKSLADAEELRDSLMSEKSNLSGELTEKEAEIKLLNEGLKKARQEFQRLSMNASSLNREVSSKESELYSVREELRRSNESRAVMSRLCSALNNDLERTENEQEQCKSTLEQLELLKATLTSQLTESVSQIEVVRAELSNAQQEVEKLKNERDQLLTEVEELRVHLKVSKAQAIEFAIKLSTLESQNAEMQLKLSTTMCAARMHGKERSAPAHQVKTTKQEMTAGKNLDIRELGGEAPAQEDEACEAWTLLKNAKKELRPPKESPLRTRTRLYKEQFSQHEGPGGCQAQAVDETGAAPHAMSPVVTRVSVRGRSPSKTRYVVTVSAGHAHPAPASSNKSGAEKSVFTASGASEAGVSPNRVSRAAVRTGRQPERPMQATSSTSTEVRQSSGRSVPKLDSLIHPLMAPTSRIRPRNTSGAASAKEGQQVPPKTTTEDHCKTDNCKMQ